MHKTVRMQEITPAVATSMLEKMSYEGQRTTRSEHVRFLANEMRQKRFIGNTLAICEMPGGTQLLVNGYHTLKAIVEAQTSQIMPVEFFQTKSYQDVAKVYARFDRQLKRTRLDTWRVYGLEEQFNLPSHVITKFAAACVVIMKDFSSGGTLSYVSDDEVALFMIDWLDSMQQFRAAVADTPLVQIMHARHVMPVALITIQYNKSADTFWKSVATDDALELGDPAKTLHYWLRDTGLTRDSSKRRVVTLPVGMRAVSAAWNARCDGRPLSRIQVNNTTLPIVIRQTPYDPHWNKTRP